MRAFGSKMKSFLLILSCTAILAALSAAVDAQELFGGHGIGTAQNSSGNGQGAGSRWSNLMDFSTDKKPEPSRFQLFGSKSGAEGSRLNWFRRSEEDSDGLFGGMPSLLPKRDPDNPGFLKQLNSKSRDFIGRTSDWAHSQNQNLRNRTFDRWDAITKDLRIRQPKQDATEEPAANGMQPPLRSAESLKGQPSVRF